MSQARHFKSIILMMTLQITAAKTLQYFVWLVTIIPNLREGLAAIYLHRM